MKQFRKPRPEKGKHIQAKASATKPTNQESPKFSFYHLQSSHCISKCEKNEKVAFVDALFKRSQMTWQQLLQAGKHHLGSEVIDRDSIKAAIPPFITDEVTLLAFRFNGNAPMVGYRDGSTFHVIWIDRAFDLYDH